jgi:Flp pilus assembly protein TadG
MRSLLRKFIRNSHGVASLEFALVMPLMVVLLYAIYEGSQFVRANMQLANAATSIADLIAQQGAGVTSGPTGVLGNFCRAGQLMMTPFPTVSTSGAGAFSVAMVSVTNYANTGVTLDWESDKSCVVTATAIGATAKTLATSPTNLLPNAGTTGTPGDSVIIVQATYQYSSVMQYLMPGIFTLSQTAFARPRSNLPVTCGAPCS